MCSCLCLFVFVWESTRVEGFVRTTYCWTARWRRCVRKTVTAYWRTLRTASVIVGEAVPWCQTKVVSSSLGKAQLLRNRKKRDGA
uniref:Putative secreted protein n=1 Tax=Anopheles darlingi TaxID=43151 RepID=A0A2M4D8D1_ANODA